MAERRSASVTVKKNVPPGTKFRRYRTIGRAYPGLRFASSGLQSFFRARSSTLRVPGMTNDSATASLHPSYKITAPVSLHPCHHRQPPDALVVIGVEEGVVVLEGHAAVGIAVGAAHVGVREQAAAPVDRVLAADRGQPQRRHAME